MIYLNPEHTKDWIFIRGQSYPSFVLCHVYFSIFFIFFFKIGSFRRKKSERSWKNSSQFYDEIRERKKKKKSINYYEVTKLTQPIWLVRLRGDISPQQNNKKSEPLQLWGVFLYFSLCCPSPGNWSIKWLERLITSLVWMSDFFSVVRVYPSPKPQSSLATA